MVRVGAAKPLDERKADIAELQTQLPDLFEKAKEMQAKLVLTPGSVALDETKTKGTVTIKVTGGEEDVESTIDVRLENDAWCVATGWAENKRLEGIASSVEEMLTATNALMEAWKFDEARAKLEEAEKALSEIPEDHSAGIVPRSSMETTKTLLDLKAKDWLGGRWAGTQETDPMTDELNAVARLTSIDGIPNSIGRLEHASLILRCQKGEFEAYVNAGTMLDSDYRYDTVSGQHRFDDAKAEKLVGGVSTSRDSIFLRNPKQWAQTFKEKDGSKWLVEVPVYNRTPQTVTFDLTGATKAVDLALGACSG